jgi:hypothetical protein
LFAATFFLFDACAYKYVYHKQGSGVQEPCVPIAGGAYIIHIDVPGIGEKILTWFGIARQVDLDNF